MKKSNKYSLLSKNEQKKQRNQQDWVQMQSVSRWQGKACNNDTSYVKFQQEQSEIEQCNVTSNKMGQRFSNKSSSMSSSSAIDKKRLAYLQNESVSQQQSMRKLAQQQQQRQQKQQHKSSTLSQSQSHINNPTTTKSQYPKNNNNSNPPLNNNMNPQYHGQQFPNNHYYPHQSMYMTNNNNNINNIGYRHSQMPMYSQSYYPLQQQYQKLRYPQQQYPQQNTSTLTTKQSTINPNRSSSSTLKGIPQMQIIYQQFQRTVNCDKCTFTQSVPGNSQMYICCICNQINQCFPLYGVFTCGICRANVIYPHGTSMLIKCTRCLTVNRVNPQPSKRVDGVVAMGKEQIQLQQQEKTVVVYQQQKPFKILPVKEKRIQIKHQKQQQQQKQKQQQQVDFFGQQNNNNNNNNNKNNIIINQPPKSQQILQQTNKLHRQATKPTNTQSYPQLLSTTLNNKQQCNKNNKQQFHEQLIQLAQKLDQCFVVTITNDVKQKQKQKQFKCEQNHDHKLKKQKDQQQYPSIFDD